MMASPRFASRLALLVLVLVGCDGGGAPMLVPVGLQEGRVNERLRIDLPIDNPSGRAVGLRVEAPSLPSFDRVTTLSTEPGGGVFTWVPLASHVGMHELEFVLTAGEGGGELDRQRVLVTILPAADAAPVFVRPGAGGTFDLTQNPCVTFDVEVRDDDSEAVNLGTRVDPPAGATLANAGPKRATFDWCPTPDQVAASQRWTIQLFADDETHPPVEHDYVIVLRSGPPRTGCAGTPPVITLRSPLMSERITSGTTFPVQVTITDDLGLRDAPLLYYSRTPPEDLANPDPTIFDLATFQEDGGGSYTARIPSLGLMQGQEATVYFFVSATDNDDPAGSACDQTTDSPVTSFVAVGGVRPDGTLASCEPCGASTECSSGICAATAGGGRCVPSCSGSGVCMTGECGATVTTEGGTRAGCGPARDLCGLGGGACVDDRREDNDSIATATPYTTAITDGQICASDDDYFRLGVPANNRVTVTLDGFSHAAGDLELQLLSSTGSILASSASARDVETVSHCSGPTAATLFARVYGFSGAQNAYALRATVAADATCCVDDRFEPDDTRTTARTVPFGATFEGTVCPADDDWIAIPMESAGRIQASVTFDAGADIDIELYGPTGARIASSAGVEAIESIDVTVPGGGAYALRIFLYGGASSDYLGEITRTLTTMCTSTLSCPIGTVCASGSCRSDACTSAAMCPAMHGCPPVGPAPAPRACALSCTTNAQCRAEEACKWFVGERGCGRRGTGANGARCASAADCGGQRTCLDWPGGYCARAGCRSNADCEGGTFCVPQGGINVCAVDCSANVDLCRWAEDHWCDIRTDLSGTRRDVCVPFG
jgi:hypothetical protein